MGKGTPAEKLNHTITSFIVLSIKKRMKNWEVIDLAEIYEMALLWHNEWSSVYSRRAEVDGSQGICLEMTECEAKIIDHTLDNSGKPSWQDIITRGSNMLQWVRLAGSDVIINCAAVLALKFLMSYLFLTSELYPNQNAEPIISKLTFFMTMAFSLSGIHEWHLHTSADQ